MVDYSLFVNRIDFLSELYWFVFYISECKKKWAVTMIPSEILAEDLMSTVIRYGLYIGAAFQLFCLLACVTLSDEQSEHHPYEKSYTDSDECSSEQSSPGHRATMSRARRHEKKKRR